jgi:hypothetical protein
MNQREKLQLKIDVRNGHKEDMWYWIMVLAFGSTLFWLPAIVCLFGEGGEVLNPIGCYVGAIIFGLPANGCCIFITIDEWKQVRRLNREIKEAKKNG